MKAIFQVVAAGILSIGGLSASTITTPSELAGTVGTYGISTFDATALTMGGLKVVVTWYDGATSNCAWTNGLNGCSATGFSISEADGLLDTYDGTWSFTNSFNPAAGSTSVKSISLIGSGIDNPTGGVGFDICWNAGGGGTQNWTNSGAFITCGDVGTTGTDVGWTASSRAGGRNISTSSVTYTDRVRTSGGPANGVGDEFSEVTLNFGSGVFGNSATAFTWRMDSDLLLANVPEPATFGLVGLSLLALGAASSRRKRS